MVINSNSAAGYAPLTGLGGIHNGIDRVAKAANDIAHVSVQGSNQLPSELSDALVELKQGKHQVEASAAVIKTVDEVLGTLIDISV
ncbi:MAG: hypothetical protein ACR2P1_26850 [Pseudomonadales bacterium]